MNKRRKKTIHKTRRHKTRRHKIKKTFKQRTNNTIFTKPIKVKEDSIIIYNNQSGNIIPGLRKFLN